MIFIYIKNRRINLKKYISHFLNSVKGGTVEKEAAYPVTGERKKLFKPYNKRYHFAN